jgi:hypothetical protein
MMIRSCCLVPSNLRIALAGSPSQTAISKGQMIPSCFKSEIGSFASTATGVRSHGCSLVPRSPNACSTVSRAWCNCESLHANRRWSPTFDRRDIGRSTLRMPLLLHEPVPMAPLVEHTGTLREVMRSCSTDLPVRGRATLSPSLVRTARAGISADGVLFRTDTFLDKSAHKSARCMSSDQARASFCVNLGNKMGNCGRRSPGCGSE